MTGVFYVPPNKSQHTKLSVEKKILPPPLPGFKLAAFQPFTSPLLLPTSYPGIPECPGIDANKQNEDQMNENRVR